MVGSSRRAVAGGFVARWRVVAENHVLTHASTLVEARRACFWLLRVRQPWAFLACSRSFGTSRCVDEHVRLTQSETHVEKYRGRTLGVDAYVWLHRGTYACAADLALGKPTTRYVAYAMHRIRMLKHYGVHPYVVFDGGHLPSKARTEAERETCVFGV